MVKIILLNLLSSSEECLRRLAFQNYLCLYILEEYSSSGPEKCLLYDSLFVFCQRKSRLTQSRKLLMLLLKKSFPWMLHGYAWIQPFCWDALANLLKFIAVKELLDFTLSNERRCISVLCWFCVQWVATNLRRSSPVGPRSSSSYSWIFDLNGISEMYNSYEDTNLW